MSKTKEEQREYDRIYYQKNKEKRKKQNSVYYQTNKTKLNKKNSLRYRRLIAQSPETIKKYHKKYAKAYYINNKEEINIKNKNWSYNNKEKVRQQKRKYLLINPLAKIAACLRSRLGSAIANNIKTGKTLELLGCSIVQLKDHLESKFQEGMSWDNYGRKGWHIDHIRPCASFDLGDPGQQKKCFHYTNLQPLWARDNIAKRAIWHETCNDIMADNPLNQS